MSERVNPIAMPQPDRTSQSKGEAAQGVEVDGLALDEVRRLLGDVSQHPDLLIEHLHRMQDQFGHLSAAHLAALAQEMRLAQAQVFEVARFYHHFDVVQEGETAPPGLTVRVCDGLACRMAGAGDLLAGLPRLLGNDVRVIASACIGRCERAPAVAVGQNPVAPARVETVMAAVAADAIHPPPQSLCDYIDYATYRAAGGYRLLQECTSGKRDAESVIRALEESGLRGLGGAGIPARKWRNVRAEPGPRLMAVDIDEGEPGTFKDRALLERDPHRFLEGMLIAAWAVDIEQIYIYLRDEYHGCREMLANEIESLLLELPLSGLPPIHLRRSAGACICGEESAMIESIEGRCGLPRLRPPDVARVGLFGRPTLVHSFETLFWVREVLERGNAWFASFGRHGRAGLRWFSVSGRVKDPGLKLAPAGITIAELIDEFCGGMQEGHRFYAYLPGGASGGILPATLNDIPLDFDTLRPYGCAIGRAGVIVLSQRDTAVDAARSMMRFFTADSCGQCARCRADTAKAAALIEKRVWDLNLLGNFSKAMRDVSICALGHAAPNPVDCVVTYFSHELTATAR